MRKILAICAALLVVVGVAADAFGTAASITVNSKSRVSLVNKQAVIASLTVNSGTYSAGGISLTAADLGLNKIEYICVAGPGMESGYAYSVMYGYDYTNSKLIAYRQGANSPSATTATVAYNKTANTTDGADTIYLHTYDGVNGWFEAVVSDDADTICMLADSSYLFIRDNDSAATGGTIVYVNLQGTTADRKLVANIPSGRAIFIPTTNSAAGYVGSEGFVVSHATSFTNYDALHVAGNSAANLDTADTTGGAATNTFSTDDQYYGNTYLGSQLNFAEVDATLNYSQPLYVFAIGY